MSWYRPHQFIDFIIDVGFVPCTARHSPLYPVVVILGTDRGYNVVLKQERLLRRRETSPGVRLTQQSSASFVCFSTFYTRASYISRPLNVVTKIDGVLMVVSTSNKNVCLIHKAQ